VDAYLEENHPDMKADMTDGFDILVSKKSLEDAGLDSLKNIFDYR
jgi:hypothetical protein